MRYFIHNEKNEYDKSSFETLLYDACKSEVLNDKEGMITKLTPFNSDKYIHRGLVLQAIEIHYKKVLQRVYNGEKVLVDDIYFYKLDKEEGNNA